MRVAVAREAMAVAARVAAVKAEEATAVGLVVVKAAERKEEAAMEEGSSFAVHNYSSLGRSHIDVLMLRDRHPSSPHDLDRGSRTSSSRSQAGVRMVVQEVSRTLSSRTSQEARAVDTRNDSCRLGLQ